MRSLVTVLFAAGMAVLILGGCSSSSSEVSTNDSSDSGGSDSGGGDSGGTDSGGFTESDLFASRFLTLNAATGEAAASDGSSTPDEVTVLFARLDSGTASASTEDQVDEDGFENSSSTGFLRSTAYATFYISAYELTQGQWNALANQAGLPGLSDPWTDVSPSAAVGAVDNDLAPAYGLSHSTIMRVLDAWNANHTDLDMVLSLPTGVQWEIAARGGDSGTTSNYLWGDAEDVTEADQIAWVRETVERDNPLTIGVRPVGSLDANAAGLFDVQGNVWEWVGPSGSAVLRGGSWSDNLISSALGNRLVVDESTPYALAGVRLIAEPR